MRVLHTADWHLGRLFHGLHLTHDQSKLLNDIVTISKEEKIDAVLLAGDVYDRAVPPVDAVQLLNEFITKVSDEIKIPLIMIAGNHDSPDRLGFGSRLLEKNNLHIRYTVDLEASPVVIEDKWDTIDFIPIPYIEPISARHLLRDDSIIDHQSSMVSAIRNYGKGTSKRKIIIAHCYTAGNLESESERPLSIGGAYSVNHDLFKSYSYAALGHLHRPQKAGLETIRYAGSLMRYSFSEGDQQKGVVICDIDREGSASIKTIPLYPERQVRTITGSLKDLLAGKGSGSDSGNREDYLCARLTDSGALFDALGRLRERYPNLLHIERTEFQSAASKSIHGDPRKSEEKDLFKSFFEQSEGIPLNENQEKLFGEMVEDLKQELRENRGDT
jgi:DNA repair protein SbcD/Mre11